MPNLHTKKMVKKKKKSLLSSSYINKGMASVGVQGLVALAVSGIIGIYIILQFTPLMVNSGAVVIVLTGLFAVLVAYAVIRVFL